MNLAIDIGNTLIKTGLFGGKEPEVFRQFSFDEAGLLAALIKTWSPQSAIWVSVAEVPESLKPFFEDDNRFFRFDYQSKTPVKNLYRTPATLGLDRLANTCGAVALFPGNDVLVLDAGTCLKYDFVNQAGEYLGGAISPGLRMRYAALNRFTAKLPLLDTVPDAELIGRDTNGSIHSGVMNGMIAEISGICEEYRKLFPQLKILMTGGDASLFLNRFKSPIFAAPNLTLYGLNAILRLQQ